MAISQEVYASLNILYASQAPSASDISLWQTNPSLTSLSWEETVLVFANSDAAKETYPLLAAPGAATDATRKQYVLEVFNNAYGLQEADLDPAEIDYWVEWLSLTNSDGSPADSDGNGIPNILDFPIVLNQFQPPAIQQALLNRAEVALDFAQQFFQAGIATFDQALYDTSWNVISTVTADPASVTAAELLTAQAVRDTIGGGTGTTFTLLDNGAVLTAAANSKVAPEGKFLSTANDKVSALTFLNGSFVQDPSTSDNDVLTAQIVGFVTPNIENIETIQFSGAAGATVLLQNISKAKQVQVVKGDLTIVDANNYAIDLVAGYASNLTLQETVGGKDLTVNLNGTTAGASIAANLFDKSKVNLVVKADSVLSNADTTLNTLALNQTQSNFVITGDKNLTIDGKIDVFDGTNRLDATDFTGELTLTLGKNSDITQIVGGKTNDTFTLTAEVNQINLVNLNGNDGNDTLTVKVGATAAAINGVTNVETIIFKEDTDFNTTITTVDTLVASGATLTVDASSFTTKTLTFNGAAETNGSFKITGGALVDVLTGGDKNDTLTGNGDLDNLTGGGGNDQFVLNKATAGNDVTITDFSIVANNNDVFALSNAAFTGAPAVGASLAVSLVAGATNSANTILVDTFANLTANQTATGLVRFGYATDNGKLFYDANGNFSTDRILIATTAALNLNASNFAIVA
ncbi:hemolysin [Microcystis sp. LEGE 00066]|uniref:calcium-binding protein n=1 Tax=Microcystis sp. LEGE 00066 TaxID=1828685 RepID=UPI00187E9634|nr:calcium-binding protein [Microcystis sp. LEGE 00066]MBE9261838.1 hemolysin [Microcystis sp. LEGE 00066]